MKKFRSLNWNDLDFDSKSTYGYFHKEIDLKYLDPMESNLVKLISFCPVFSSHVLFVTHSKSMKRKTFGTDIVKSYLLDFTRDKFSSVECDIRVDHEYPVNLAIKVWKIASSEEVFENGLAQKKMSKRKKRKTIDYVMVRTRLGDLNLFRFDLKNNVRKPTLVKTLGPLNFLYVLSFGVCRIFGTSYRGTSILCDLTKEGFSQRRFELPYLVTKAVYIEKQNKLVAHDSKNLRFLEINLSDLTSNPIVKVGRILCSFQGEYFLTTKWCLTLYKLGEKTRRNSKYTNAEIVRMFELENESIDAVASAKSFFVLDNTKRVHLISKSRGKVVKSFEIPDESGNQLSRIRWADESGRNNSTIFVSGSRGLHVLVIVNRKAMKAETKHFLATDVKDRVLNEMEDAEVLTFKLLFYDRVIRLGKWML